MKSIWSFIKFVVKWCLIMFVIYTVATVISGLDLEHRMFWFLAGLGLFIAYVDGSNKEKIADLQYQINELSRRVNGI